MRADVDRLGAQGGQLPEQLLAVLHVGVVRLVVAEEPPDGPHLAPGLRGVDADGDGERSAWGLGLGPVLDGSGGHPEGRPPGGRSAGHGREVGVMMGSLGSEPHPHEAGSDRASGAGPVAGIVAGSATIDQDTRGRHGPATPGQAGVGDGLDRRDRARCGGGAVPGGGLRRRQRADAAAGRGGRGQDPGPGRRRRGLGHRRRPVHRRGRGRSGAATARGGHPGQQPRHLRAQAVRGDPRRGLAAVLRGQRDERRPADPPLPAGDEGPQLGPDRVRLQRVGACRSPPR